MRTVLALVLVLVLESLARADTLEAKLKTLVGDRDVSVVYQELGRDASVRIREHVVFHAASTMKLPVMMALHAKPAASLEEKVLVANRFASIVDGSEFQLEKKDDEDARTWEHLGDTLTVRELIERMIVRSSNLATNLLMARADPATVTSLCRSLGCEETKVLRGVEDQKAFDRGLNNVTSAHDLALLLEAIGRERVQGARAMRDVLARQELNEGIPAGLPAGTKVAHKTGSITRIYHDAALVLPEAGPGYVLVVLTRGFADEKDAVALVKEISRLVWESRR